MIIWFNSAAQLYKKENFHSKMLRDHHNEASYL